MCIRDRAEFDRNAAMQQQRISDQAVASGAFGGGREGVAQAEYMKGSDMNRAQLQAGLLHQVFKMHKLEHNKILVINKV